MPAPFEGGCRCRAIRYRCISEPGGAVHCYCRDCQYASGGACTTALVVLRDDVTVTGTPTAWASQADSGVTVERLFCATCGTPLFARNPDTPALMAIKAATLDDPSWVQPGAHIWTASAPPWARTDDGLPTFPRNFGHP